MKRLQLHILVLLCVVLLSSVGSSFSHPNTCFLLYSALLPKRDFSAILLGEWTGRTEVLTDEDWATDARVTVSDTLMLVNAEHPLPEDYVPQLSEYNGAKMHPLMVPAYIALRDATAEATGKRIFVSSDYRTREEQEAIFAESEEGIAAAIGCSEHEAGLALDVYTAYYAGIHFTESTAGRFVNLRCAEYGYIIRYPKAKESVTGISYEPWHLRYVGAPHAKRIAQSGLALEEYLSSYLPSVWYDIGDGFYVLRTQQTTVALPENMDSCMISPDNMGYYFFTVHLAT